LKIWRALKWLITPQNRPLSHVRDGARFDVNGDPKPQLGFEAIDMAHVERVQRQNQALERTNTVTTSSTKRERNGGFLSAANLATTQSYEDKDYAKRYYALFQKNKDRTK